MNYRHAFHAGNFADVVKHAVLALVVEHLKRKPAPFRVVDTHAGAGWYDISGAQAARTGEWKDGIGRIWGTTLPTDVEEILRPYLAAVASANPAGVLARYPGSPVLVRALLRRGDTLVANELHPEDVKALEAHFARDPQTKVLSLDAWTAVKSLLPPKERRGVVLIDPPFEEPGEFRRLAQALDDAVRRFATGTVMLWYPVKEARAVARFHRDVTALGLAKVAVVDFAVRAPSSAGALSAMGMVILNPPFSLLEKLEVLLPFLVDLLAQGRGAGAHAAWLSGEQVTSS